VGCSTALAAEADAVGTGTGGEEGVNSLGRCGVWVVDVGFTGEARLERDLSERDGRLLAVSG